MLERVICFLTYGVIYYAQRNIQKNYMPKLKQTVVEILRGEHLSIRDVMRGWERIYLEEGPEGLAAKRCGQKVMPGRRSCLRRSKKNRLQRTNACKQR